MKIRSLFIVLAVSLICISSCSNTNKSVDEIIALHLKAIGGYENLKSVNTKIIKGTYIEPGYNLILKSKVFSKRGDQRLVMGSGLMMEYFFEGYNGEVVWEYYVGDSEPRIMDGEAFKAAKRGAEFDDSFIDYKEKGHSIDYLGLTDLQGVQTHTLEVSLNDGWVKTYYIDAETYLIYAMKKSMPLHAKGDHIDFLVYFNEYREVDGILMPFVKVERDVNNNYKMINSFVIDEIIFNPVLDSIDFEPHIPTYLIDKL